MNKSKVMIYLLLVVILLSLIGTSLAQEKPVWIKSKIINQMVTSSLLSWEKYDRENFRNQFKFAVCGGEIKDKLEARPYICRINMNLMGHVRVDSGRKKHVCSINRAEGITSEADFELLINRDNIALLKWVPLNRKSSLDDINGAVSVNIGSTKKPQFIVRYKSTGWVHPYNFIYSMRASVRHDEPQSYQVEVLVEVDPIHYELINMHFDDPELQTRKERRLLAGIILENKHNQVRDIKASIQFEYERKINSGFNRKLIRSTNTTLRVAHKNSINLLWGIDKTVQMEGWKDVGAILQPKSAINVTLFGNFYLFNGSYDSKLITYFADGTKRFQNISVSSAILTRIEEPLEVEESREYKIED